MNIKRTYNNIKIKSDYDVFIIGKNVKCNSSLHDSWMCPQCESYWLSYFASEGIEVNVNFLK